uniref:NAD(P)(+)--arginine ADP-ribosyltransferase n=1 Tax=Amphiprion percula TaxID=161767 RepID=A0A3P8S177_AMPPE
MNMLIFARLCLPLCWLLSVESMWIRFNFTVRDANEPIPLGIVEDSVDDMYMGCSEEMMNTVTHKYNEELRVGPYAETLKMVENCIEEKLKEREDEALTKNHMQALCAYTSDNVYENFNIAVRTKGSVYTSSFQFHILHFFLTSAIQILNNNNYCYTTYRRTKVMFTGKVSQRIRFGSFASSSFKTDLREFGNKSCFKITTCSGAPLKRYSSFEPEAEVLIPPYEVFRITDKLDGKSKLPGLDDCAVVFVLKSEGGQSRLNCKTLHI